MVFALVLRVRRLEAAFLRPSLSVSWWPRERYASRLATARSSSQRAILLSLPSYDGYGFFSVFLTVSFSVYVHWIVIFGISTVPVTPLSTASRTRYGKHGSFAFRGSGARVLLWVSCLVTRRITTWKSRGRPGFNSLPRRNFVSGQILVLMSHADQVCSAM